MTSRFTQDSFTTASVGPGVTLGIDRDMPDNAIDIFQIKITPNSSGGTAEFFIHKSVTASAGNLVYATAPWPGDTAEPFYDPVEERGANYYGRSESFICRYEDSDVGLHLHLQIKNNDSGAHTYDVVITYAVTTCAAVSANKPDGLVAKLLFNGLFGLSDCVANYNNASLSEGEFRAMYVDPTTVLPAYVDLRTAAEGGSFAHNGTTQLIITGLRAARNGSTCRFTSGAQGRWYFAWRLKNTYGWSNWTDGNLTPSLVYQYADTSTLTDTGPPDDWEVTVQPGSIANTYIASASRPRTKGGCILFFWAQFKDASTGAWRALDENTGAAETYYDGSGSNHSYDPATGEISNGGAGWGTATVGDLVLIDVRGDTNFDVNYCTWVGIEAVGTTLTIEAWDRFQSTAHMTGSVYDRVRIKIVKPPWAWTTEGYLGATPGYGLWNENTPGNNWIYANFTDRSFTTGAVQVPSSVANVECRVWFENRFSRSDGGIIHSTDLMGNASDYIEGDYTWTQFSDRNWWIPTLQGQGVTLTMEADGTITGAAITSALINEIGYAGPAGRFRIFPSRLEGEIQIRTKWSVSLTRGPALTANAGGVGLFLQLPGQGLQYYGYDCALVGLVLREKRATTPTLSDLEIGLAVTTPQSETTTPPSISTDALVTIPNVSVPTNPFDVELRLHIKSDSAEKLTTFNVAEYQIAGGGWNTITQTAIVRRCGGVHMFGIRPFPIYYQHSSGTGSYATLEEFQVIKGICARY
jgi:hypothetical protein